jgi:hypothetical protein
VEELANWVVNDQRRAESVQHLYHITRLAAPLYCKQRRFQQGGRYEPLISDCNSNS